VKIFTSLCVSFLSSNRTKLDMSLTAHQEEKLEELLNILETSDRAVLKGSAGVGKTWLLDELLRKLLNKGMGNKKFYISAPTNKAVGVLAGKIHTKASNIDLITIHKGLKYSKRIDKKTGVETFEPTFNERNPPLQGVKYLVIDECSMIGVVMLGEIEKYATRFRVKVIFVGDDKQALPVNESVRSVFRGVPVAWNDNEEAIEWEEYPTVELTEIIRQGAGNPIITLSRNLSAIWEYQSRMIEGKGFVYTMDESRIVRELAAINGSDELKYLAWTNADVNDINSQVRNLIYGQPAKVELGESLIFDAHYGEYYTSEEIKVDTLNIEQVPFHVVLEDIGGAYNVQKTSIKCYVINGEQVDEWGDGNLTWKGVFVIHEDSEKQLTALSRIMAGNCSKGKLKWDTKSKFLSKFAKIKYNHALTVHKAQGSTYRQTILNVGNLNLNPDMEDKMSLIYTGVTRSEDLLILYNV